MGICSILCHPVYVKLTILEVGFVETLLIILVVAIVLLAFGIAYCLGYLKGFKDFEEIQNDYGNRLADLFLDYIKRTEN